MSRIDFYHLQRFRLEDALPRLLERVLASGQRALVVADSEERVEHLTAMLWEDRALWLPHGNVQDGHAADQPVWLTADPADCPNQPGVLVLCCGMDSPLVANLPRTLDIFDGNDETAVLSARQRWKQGVQNNHDLYYWQQEENGRWTEKARRLSGDSSQV